jgi:hypothetical protein
MKRAPKELLDAMSETIKLCAMVVRHDQSEWSDDTREAWVEQACRARDEHDAMKREIQVLSPRGYNKEIARLRAENAELRELRPLKHVTAYHISTLRVNRQLTKGEEAAVLTALIDHYDRFDPDACPIDSDTFLALCDRRQALFPMNDRTD